VTCMTGSSDFSIAGNVLDLSSAVTAPGTLDVVGLATLNSNTTSTKAIGTTFSSLDPATAGNFTSLDSTAFAAGVGGGIVFGGKYNAAGSYSQGGAAIKALKANATDGNFGFDLGFATRPNGGNLNERMRIEDSGELLVGATSRTGTFQGNTLLLVSKPSGDTVITAQTISEDRDVFMAVEDSTNKAIIGTTVSQPLEFRTANTERMTISSAGAITISGSLGITGALTASTAAATFGDLRGTVLAVGSVSGALDNWAPTGHATATHFVVTGTSAITLTGLQGGAAGRIVTITNAAAAGAADIQISHDVTSTGANRFSMANGSNWSLTTGTSATFIYNATASRWLHIETRTFPSMFVTSFQGDSITINTTLASNGNTTLGAAESSTTTLTGKFLVSGSDPAITSCGSSPSISGNDMAGIITVGSGTATACTLTFANTYGTEPMCVITAHFNNASPFYFSAKSATAFTVTTPAGANFASTKINYVCIKV
jgi:hypothetical protein